jgi:hypothetical protein
MTHWPELLARQGRLYEEGLASLPDELAERQRALTRVASAAYAAALAALMAGDRDEAVRWSGLAAAGYRESYADAPAGSWGRPIGAIKARLLVGDAERAREEARWALDEGAEAANSAIGRYAAALARLALGQWADARVHADALRGRDDFPGEVADTLAAIAAADVVAYTTDVEAVLRSFETRDEFLQDAGRGHGDRPPGAGQGARLHRAAQLGPAAERVGRGRVSPTRR